MHNEADYEALNWRKALINALNLQAPYMPYKADYEALNWLKALIHALNLQEP